MALEGLLGLRPRAGLSSEPSWSCQEAPELQFQDHETSGANAAPNRGQLPQDEEDWSRALYPIRQRFSPLVEVVKAMRCLQVGNPRVGDGPE